MEAVINNIPRDAGAVVSELLDQFPVVMLEGARQVGKSTLAAGICDLRGGTYLSLDSIQTLHEARTGPEHLLSDAGPGLVVVDEIQRYPELFLTVKLLVDKNRRPGMFLLTGSSDRYRMRHDFETLAGRKASVFLRPMSQMEIGDRVFQHAKNDIPAKSGRSSGKQATRNVNLVDEMFLGNTPLSSSNDGLQQRVALGGYPMAVTNTALKERAMNHYVNNELVGEFVRLSRSDAIPVIPLLLEKLAAKQGKLINMGDLAREVGQTGFVTKSLADLLGNAFLLEHLPSFPEKLGQKSTSRKAKAYMNDSGLSTTLLELDGQDLTASHHWGMLLETFVLSELRKNLETCSFPGKGHITYYRENNGIEVDFVIRGRTGNDLIAIEVKASNKVRDNDWRNLRVFRKISSGRCKRALLFYTGSEVIRLNEHVEAWPISCLWACR